MRLMKAIGVPSALFAALCLSLSACGRSEPASSTSGQPSAPAPAAPPAVGVYVTNETSGDLTIIDGTTQSVIATLPLGKRPRGLASSPDGMTLYVALSGSPPAPPGIDESTLPPPDRSADGIGVVDIRARKLLKVLPSGTDPECVAVSHDGRQLYVANEDASILSVIDVASAKVIETFKIGEEPEGVSVEAKSDRVWVTSEEDAAVYVIDVAAHKIVKSVKVGPRPRTIGFLPDGSKAYVPSETTGNVAVIDVNKLVPLSTINLGPVATTRPMAAIPSPDGKFVYVSTGRGRNIVFIDTATDKVVGSVQVGARPWGIAVSGDGKTLYSANGPSNDVSVVDTATRTVTKTIPVGTSPWGVIVVEKR
jgi:YVTN family beta-propeller protein